MTSTARHDVMAMLAVSGLQATGPQRTRTGGELSAVYEVPTTDGPVIVKVYGAQWQWKQAKEQYVYGLLAPVLDEGVPSVIDVQDDTSPTGHAYTILSLMPGRPLSEVDIDPAARSEVYRQLGALAARMHTVGQPAFGYLTTEVLDPRPTNRQYVVDRFERHLNDFVERGGDRDLADRIAGVLHERAESLERCTQAVVVHNDLHAGNVLVEPNGGGWAVRGIIDVENALAGDPLADLAKTETYSIRGETNDLHALFDGYGTGGLIDDPRFGLYCVFHCLELWVWFAQTGRTDALDSLTAQATIYMSTLLP